MLAPDVLSHTLDCRTRVAVVTQATISVSVTMADVRCSRRQQTRDESEVDPPSGRSSNKGTSASQSCGKVVLTHNEAELNEHQTSFGRKFCQD